MGSLLNGVVNYNSAARERWIPGTKDFFDKYPKRAVEAKVDPLGYYLAPFGYAIGQMLEQAIKAASRSTTRCSPTTCARTPEDHRRSDQVRADGEWKETGVVMAQFRGVVDKNIEQFRSPGKQVILFPEKLKTGDLITPFEKARK